jgi:hypothetical protein
MRSRSSTLKLWILETVAVSVCVVAGVAAVPTAQPPRASAAGQAAGSAQGRTGGRGQQGGAPISFDDRTGFRPIFDGSSLAGWDGDPMFWRAESGAIVGESTAEKVLKENTFLIWKGGEPADFELKLEFRINSTNSGVQYRSVHLPAGSGGVTGQWVLKGYQADIDFANQYTGMLYEERGRAFLALRGSFGYVGPNQPPARGAIGNPPVGTSVRGPIGQLENGEALKGYIRVNEWNQFHVVARGAVLVHVLNGHVTALFVDDDPVGRSLKGLLGLQLHTGAPMKVEFRNIFLKTL